MPTDRCRYRRGLGNRLMLWEEASAPGATEVDGEGALGRGTGNDKVVGGAGCGYRQPWHGRRITMGTKGAEPIWSRACC
jgi:hypothetical protein